MPYSAGGLGRALQPAQLLARLGRDLFGHVGLVDGGAQFGDLGAAALVLAQLALDGGQLLAQHRLALALGEASPGSGPRSRATGAAPAAGARSA